MEVLDALNDKNMSGWGNWVYNLTFMRGKTVNCPPISDETMRQMVGEWGRIIQFRESGCIYLESKSQILWRFKQLFTDKRLNEKIFGHEYEYKIIDLEALNIEDVEDLWANIQITNELNTLIVIGADILLRERNTVLIQTLNNLALDRGLSVLLFFSLDFNHPQNAALFVNCHSLLQNTVFHRLYEVNDTQQFIKYLQDKWKIRIPIENQNNILYECGGSLWLIKESCRLIRGGHYASRKLLENDSIKIKLGLMWEKFSESERQVFIHVLKNQNSMTSSEKSSELFLVKTGWLKQEGKFKKFSIPILEAFLRDEILKVDLVVESDHIYFNKVLIDSYFSKKERSVLKIVLNRTGEIVEREEIARSLWGDQWESKYSDWAVDQLVSRLRKRLKSLGIQKESLRTIRGRGLKYEND